MLPSLNESFEKSCLDSSGFLSLLPTPTHMFIEPLYPTIYKIFKIRIFFWQNLEMGDEDLICSNVTVAVRVRPSNERRREWNVVDTCGEKTLSVSHPSEHGSKRFTRFHSFAYPKCSHTHIRTVWFFIWSDTTQMRFIKIWQNLLWTKRSWDTTERYSRLFVRELYFSFHVSIKYQTIRIHTQSHRIEY